MYIHKNIYNEIQNLNYIFKQRHIMNEITFKYTIQKFVHKVSFIFVCDVSSDVYRSIPNQVMPQSFGKPATVNFK